MKLKILTITYLLLHGLAASAQQAYNWKNGNSGGFAYKYVTGDPTKSRIYTLKNGLTVILSENHREPNISYKMVVRAGSNTDPKNNTGLAHYLEHLLFKGTDKFGTTNYAKEKGLLDKIESLYEVYNKTKDQQIRADLYKQIDMISGEASKIAIANEYDKMMKSIGSTSTNAHTSYEETIYHEDLPSNAVDKFLAVQAERFRNPIFRIFHTELEAVYEEKNRGLDNDGGKVFEAMNRAIFPVHNYGQQTTIGTVEHLKNPSLVEIRKYFNKYYVPNNMALIMAGDFNFDEMIRKIDKSFSYMVPKPIQLYAPQPEKPLDKIQELNVYGPSSEFLFLAFRGFPQNSRQSLMLELVSKILYNSKAGLMDINVNKKQEMLSASAGYNQMKDYGVFVMSASPKTGQTLEDAKKILLEQVDNLKKGRFDESLIKATVANIKFGELQAFDSNVNRAGALADAFVLNRASQWNEMLAATDAMGKITKNEIVDFARKFFIENYAVIYKRKGIDKNLSKVDKPQITPVNTNANEVSAFAKSIIEAKVTELKPRFIDYKKDLSFGRVGIADVISVKNNENGIFRLSYRFDLGSFNYRELPYAAEYLSYLGTDQKSADEVSKAFYDIACSYKLSVGNETAILSITGLQENFSQAVALVEDLLRNCKADEKALQQLKARIFKSRENTKLNKASILNGLTSYAQFGKNNPFNSGLDNKEVQALNAQDLTYMLHNLTNYKHTVTYYGPKDQGTFIDEIAKLHPLAKEFTDAAPKRKFDYVPTDSTKVLFANYDMVQAEVRWFRNSGKYEPNQAATVNVFNNYFGGGMGSMVFQVIRESKALAYSTFSVYSTPDSREKQSTVMAYVGAQADKVNEAITGMNELLQTMPEVEKSFQLSKENELNSLASSVISGEGIINKYLQDKKLGLDKDSRIEQYQNLQNITFEDVRKLHEEKFSNKPYVYLVVASQDKVVPQSLEKYGKVKIISLEEIFGF